MKRFQCQNCGNEVYFENTICISCGRRLGYAAATFAMIAVEPANGLWESATQRGLSFKFCGNWEVHACNWLLMADDPQRFCEACRHNRVVPDLSIPDNGVKWQKLELAKRFLFYSLMRWGLRIPQRSDLEPNGLVFDLIADAQKPDGALDHVFTGHDEGVITINIAEADDAERERRRRLMNEPYRTLLGHFRHEIGHYYWNLLVRDSGALEPIRAAFGDERADYSASLKRYYAEGPPPNWRDHFISSYAAAHPWEDFAETWAHYTHLVDTLETARCYGLKLEPPAGGKAEVGVEFDPYRFADSEAIAASWPPLSIALNAVNRSMGQPDIYPFVLSRPVLTKLQCIHELIQSGRQR